MAGKREPAQTSKAEHVLRTVDGLSFAGAAISGAFALLMAIMVFYEIVARTLGHPTAFATEISTFMLIAIVFLAAAYGVRENSHVQMDVVINLLSRRVRYLLDAAMMVVAMVFAVVLTVYGWELTAGSYQDGTTSSSTLGTPVFLPQLTIPLGGALLLLQLVVRMVRDLDQGLRAEPRLRAPAEGGHGLETEVSEPEERTNETADRR